MNATRNVPDAGFVTVGLAGADGEPTTTGRVGADADPMPRPLCALTVHVYVLASVTPCTLRCVDQAFTVFASPPLPDTHETTYGGDESALPLAGPGVKLTTSRCTPTNSGFSGTAVTAVGAPGVPWITAGEAADAPLVPARFVDVTLQVYVLPVVVPDTLTGLVADEPVWVTPPLLDVHVAVLFVIAAPFVAPGVKETFMGTTGDVEPDAAITAVGAAGAIAGTIELDGALAGPVPTPFVPDTVQV